MICESCFFLVTQRRVMPSIASVAISHGSTVLILVFLAKTVRASLELSDNSPSFLQIFPTSRWPMGFVAEDAWPVALSVLFQLG